MLRHATAVAALALASAARADAPRFPKFTTDEAFDAAKLPAYRGDHPDAYRHIDQHLSPPGSATAGASTRRTSSSSWSRSPGRASPGSPRSRSSTSTCSTRSRSRRRTRVPADGRIQIASP